MLKIFRLFCFLILLFTTGCLRGCKPEYDPSLPDSAELGNPRDYRIVRVIMHDHSPFSYDACDNNGLPGGKINEECLSHLRFAYCMNRIDFAFLTDHPDSMFWYLFESLLLSRGQDELLSPEPGAPAFANRLSDCFNGFKPVLMVGFEGRLLSLGMTRHLFPSPGYARVSYSDESARLRTALATQTQAVVFAPHTESWDIEKLKALNVDGIEIYNTHAYLDPKIRKRDLKVPPFEHIPGIITYFLDPYKELNPDFMFMHFLKVEPYDIQELYFRKWNALLETGAKVAGFGGTDSHENVFPQKFADGERGDSFRRLKRFMSNHLLVPDLEPQSAKTALRLGRGWQVFEGFGSPVGMDFLATPEHSDTILGGVSDTLSLSDGNINLVVKLPSLHPSSPQSQDEDEKPVIRIDLKKVPQASKTEKIATSTQADLVHTVSSPGVYRAEIWIRPKHLKPYIHPFEDAADEDYRWIVTNPIYVRP